MFQLWARAVITRNILLIYVLAETSGPRFSVDSQTVMHLLSNVYICRVSMWTWGPPEGQRNMMCIRKYLNNYWMHCHDVLHWHAWSSEEESSRLLWSPDFSSSATIPLTFEFLWLAFVVLSALCHFLRWSPDLLSTATMRVTSVQQHLGGLSWHFVQTFMLPRGTYLFIKRHHRVKILICPIFWLTASCMLIHNIPISISCTSVLICKW